MKGGGEARRTILNSIRESLAASAPHDRARAALQTAEQDLKGRKAKGIPLPLAPEGIRGSPPAVPDIPLTAADRFGAQLQAVGGRWAAASSLDEASRMIGSILKELKVETVALSDAAEVHAAMKFQNSDVLKHFTEPTQAELFDADAGVSCAQWGIAETGTLILESSEERHRMVSLVPPIHIVLLRRERICETLAEGMNRLRTSDGELESRAITFITGPSRTADIEQMLVVGVHGPQILVVIVIGKGEPGS